MYIQGLGALPCAMDINNVQITCHYLEKLRLSGFGKGILISALGASSSDGASVIGGNST